MNDKTDNNIIDNLVNKLKPKKPLLNKSLWISCSGCFSFISLAIILILGLRLDIEVAIQSGAILWKVGMLSSLLVWSIFIISDISRPDGYIKKIHHIPLSIGIIIFIYQIISQFLNTPPTELITTIKDYSSIYCVTIILLGGTMALTVMWQLWIKKTAPKNPYLLGAMAGLSSGLLVATGYALHCDKDSIIYIGLYYTIPIALLAIIGGAIGKKKLNW